MKLEDLKTGTKLRVIKDMFYVSKDDLVEDEYVTLDEVRGALAHLCVWGDEWFVRDTNEGKVLECSKGDWEGELSEGWFNVDTMLSRGVFEIIG